MKNDFINNIWSLFFPNEKIFNLKEVPIFVFLVFCSSLNGKSGQEIASNFSDKYDI